jgi:hypothetical protein
MDESKPSIPPDKFHLTSASGWTSADIDPPSAEPDQPASLERQTRCGQIEPSRSDFRAGPSVVTYYRNEEEVSRGFLVALSAMGVTPDQQSPESPKPSGGAHTQELSDHVVNGAPLSVERSRSSQES